MLLAQVAPKALDAELLASVTGCSIEQANAALLTVAYRPGGS